MVVCSSRVFFCHCYRRDNGETRGPRPTRRELGRLGARAGGLRVARQGTRCVAGRRPEAAERGELLAGFTLVERAGNLLFYYAWALPRQVLSDESDGGEGTESDGKQSLAAAAACWATAAVLTDHESVDGWLMLHFFDFFLHGENMKADDVAFCSQVGERLPVPTRGASAVRNSVPDEETVRDTQDQAELGKQPELPVSLWVSDLFNCASAVWV